MNMNEPETTLRVYSRDRDWLQSRQRKIGWQREKTPTMADVIRELIEAVMEWERSREA